MGVGRLRGLQGLAQVDAVRRAGDRGRLCAQGHGARAAKVEVFVKGPGSGRETAIRSLQQQASRSSASRTSPRRPTTVCVSASGGASNGPRSRDRKCRICRREGLKLFLKGERCLTEKCAIERRSLRRIARPRPHEQDEYLLQLREKQKARRYYGLLEQQFRGYYEKASRRSGVTGEELLRMLETRLDNVVYRLGFAVSRAQARQLVRHGHFHVNGRQVNIRAIRFVPTTSSPSRRTPRHRR